MEPLQDELNEFIVALFVGKSTIALPSLEEAHTVARSSSPFTKRERDELVRDLISSGYPKDAVEAHAQPFEFNHMRPIFTTLMRNYNEARCVGALGDIDFNIAYTIYTTFRTWKDHIPIHIKYSIWDICASIHIRELSRKGIADRAEFGFLLYWPCKMFWLPIAHSNYQGARHGLYDIKAIMDMSISDFEKVRILLGVFDDGGYDGGKKRCEWDEWDGNSEDLNAGELGFRDEEIAAMTEKECQQILRRARGVINGRL